MSSTVESGTLDEGALIDHVTPGPRETATSAADLMDVDVALREGE